MMGMLQLKLHMVTIEDLVPEDHFLRKLDAALDLSFVYEETEGLYRSLFLMRQITPLSIIKNVVSHNPTRQVLHKAKYISARNVRNSVRK